MASGKSSGTKTNEPSTFLRRAEVAELAGVSLKTVDKAIEQKTLRVRKRHGASLLDPVSVVCVSMLDKAGRRLPLPDRRRLCRFVYETPARELRRAELELSPGLIVRYNAAAERLNETMKYTRNRERFIEIDPEIRSGDPVIRGTRISVHGIANRIADGDTIEMLVEDYPHVPVEAFETALVYAKTHPRRGRPAPAWRTAAV